MSFRLNVDDLHRILGHIEVAERHVQSGYTALTDAMGNPLHNLMPFGLRTVSGQYNNLVRIDHGASDGLMPRLLAPEFREAYEQTTGSVYDPGPRTVSNLVSDQSVENPAAIVAAFTALGSTDPYGDAARYIAARSAGDETAQPAPEFDVQDSTLFIPNVMPDLGDTAPFNGFLTLFGQFFDHGLDLVSKGGSGTVFIPLQPDDPLYVPRSPTNFMVLTRATNQPGEDGILGTADDVREHRNETTPFIDLNQVYTSHASHQVFLREYARVEVDGVMRTLATGRMLEGAHGGPPTWADIKQQAREMLGIELGDMDVLRVPLVATDLYGNFQPGANGFAQLVTPGGLVPGDAAVPVSAGLAYGAGRAFLNDIAHAAAPGPGYDAALLDQHFIVGDGRGNENIGLTAVHHVFHSEHNTRVEQIKQEILASGDVGFINEWLLAPIADGTPPAGADGLPWDGERLFQAARFSTEMVYQHLVFEEFARLVSPDVDPFLFSNTVDVDPAIVAEFAHVVYRFGHSMLRETVDRLGADGQTSADIGLIDAFLNPQAFVAGGADADESAGAIIRGMTRQVGSEIDEFLTDALRNNLVGLPLDLGALNIARGRDVGVPSLNEARRQFHEQTHDTALKPYESWYDFALAIKHPASLINFVAAYGTHGTITAATTLEAKRAAASALVLGGSGAPEDRLDFLNATGAWAGGTLGGLDDVDFWIGGLAEKKMPFGGQLGSTFNFVFETQMERLQEGDRFYYLSRTQGMNLLNQLEADSFAELVMRNTDLGDANATHLPSSLFLTPAYILELERSRQKVADPNHTDPVLAALQPLVTRRDTDGDGADDYLRYAGVDHVVLGGDDHDNTLIGGEGDDTLWGDGGDDRLEGGLGVDHLFGGDGDDILTDSGTDSGAADVIHGDGGNDVINGGMGLDLIFGGAGQDFIFGGTDGKSVTAGEGNDFVRGPDGLSFIAGNEGDDWLEGGDSFDTLAGENSELFFNSPIVGHDVLDGRGNDTDYDGESGDDIMVQGLGIQRNNGMAGFDWAIHKGSAQAADSDLGIPIFVNQEEFILRDRFDLVEGLSGWVHGDTLTGRDVVVGQIGGNGGAAQATADSPFESYSNALLEQGVERITGLSELVAHLGRDSITVAGKQHRFVVFDEAAITRDAQGQVVGLEDTAADILLGGGGGDLLQGKAGNDVIDGDRWLNVRIRIEDAQGREIGWSDGLAGQVHASDGTLLYDGRTLDRLMFDRTLNPGQLSIVREILDGDAMDTATDQAIYRGNRSEYEISYHDDGSVTVSHAAPVAGGFDDGTDRLFNIESLAFADGAVSTAAPAIVGTADADVLVGDGRADSILGLGGNDFLSGLVGNDTLDGGAGNDTIHAGDGHDTIRYTFGQGTDTVDGGAGTDRLTIAGGAAGEWLNVVFAGGALAGVAGGAVNNVEWVTADLQGGSDTLSYDTTTVGITVNLTTGAASGFSSITGIENAKGGSGDDLLVGSAGIVNTLTGGEGNDIFVVDQAEDVVSGNQGVDEVRSLASAYAIGNVNTENLRFIGTGDFTGTGNAINNALTGGSGNDVLSGLDGRDTLDGGAGNDLLIGGNGNDVVSGGEGDDTIEYTFGQGVDSMDGGAGTDRLNVAGGAAGEWLNVVFAGGALTSVAGGAVSNVELVAADLQGGSDTLSYDTTTVGITVNLTTGAASGFSSIAGIENAKGGSGDDLLVGSAGVVNTLTGGEGNDTFVVDQAEDVVSGNQGTDEVWSLASAYTLANVNTENLRFIGGGDFTGTGNAARNAITGGNGNDVLSGLDGRDTLEGGAGHDLLIGGSGDDIFVFQDGFGSDTIEDFDAVADGGQDRMDLSALGITADSFAALVSVTTTATGATVVTIGEHSITLAGVDGVGDNAISQSDFLLA